MLNDHDKEFVDLWMQEVIQAVLADNSELFRVNIMKKAMKKHILVNAISIKPTLEKMISAYKHGRGL